MIEEIEGIEPGTLFKGRKELHDAEVHCGNMRGIADKGGESIVLSGGYRDDKDDGDVVSVIRCWMNGAIGAVDNQEPSRTGSKFKCVRRSAFRKPETHD